MDANGTAVLNRDIALFHHLCARAEDAGISRVLSFGRHKEAAARLLDCSLHATCSAVTASIRGKEIEYCLAMPGSHWVMNSLAVLAAVSAAGADVRSEEHTSELQSLMRISYAVFCLKKKTKRQR